MIEVRSLMTRCKSLTSWSTIYSLSSCNINLSKHKGIAQWIQHYGIVGQLSGRAQGPQQWKPGFKSRSWWTPGVSVCMVGYLGSVNHAEFIVTSG